MARNTRPPEPRPANLGPAQLESAIKKIKRRIGQLEEFEPQSVNSETAYATSQELSNAVEETLEQAFGVGTIEADRYSGAANFNYSMYMGGTPIGEIIADFDRNKKKSIQLLNAAVSVLNERMEDLVDTPRQLPVAVQSVPKQDSSNRKVFIVHGQDEGAKQAVARQLERSACVPVILHEQPNGGRTIIEKFEHNADVGFAVVLLTPDDIVTDQQGKLAKRARQNVILELGYFVGRLGRSKVMAIKKGDVDLPSDIHGVVWVEMDEYDGWKVKLAKELKSAGYPIDLNNII